MKIGDTLPIAQPIDRGELQYARQRATAVRRTAKDDTSWRGNTARKVIAETERQQRLETDPFEQARRFLGRRGTPVYSLAVYDPTFGEQTARRLIAKAGWRVGAEEVADRAGVIRAAEQAGWCAQAAAHV